MEPVEITKKEKKPVVTIIKLLISLKVPHCGCQERKPVLNILNYSAHGSTGKFLNRAMNLIVAVTFLSLVSFIGEAFTFWLYGLIAIGAWLFFYKLVPETKGKTLEQIEEHWRKGKKPREL